MKYSLVGAFACLTLLSAPLAVAAPPGPTLAASLGFIRARMIDQGQVVYEANLRDTSTDEAWTNKFTADMTNVTVDLTGCKIAFHWKTTLDGAVQADIDTSLSFRQMRKVSVVNREQEIRTQVKDSHPSWVSTVSPGVWVVTMKKADGASILDFTDEDVADRVARAVDHVLDLCGAPKAGFE